jgi:hypothetical protein
MTTFTLTSVGPTVWVCSECGGEHVEIIPHSIGSCCFCHSRVGAWDTTMLDLHNEDISVPAYVLREYL